MHQSSLLAPSWGSGIPHRYVSLNPKINKLQVVFAKILGYNALSLIFQAFLKLTINLLSLLVTLNLTQKCMNQIRGNKVEYPQQF